LPGAADHFCDIRASNVVIVFVLFTGSAEYKAEHGEGKQRGFPKVDGFHNSDDFKLIKIRVINRFLIDTSKIRGSVGRVLQKTDMGHTP